jgi:hypothetical protein
VKRTVVADELANNIGGRSENGCIYQFQSELLLIPNLL